MKTKIIIFISALLFATGLLAQTTDTATNKDHLAQKKNQKDSVSKHQTEIITDAKKIHYCCPKCDFCDIKTGKCPNHNLPLVMEGTYYCGACYTLGDRYGMCPICGNDMKIIDCKNVIKGKD